MPVSSPLSVGCAFLRRAQHSMLRTNMKVSSRAWVRHQRMLGLPVFHQHITLYTLHHLWPSSNQKKADRPQSHADLFRSPEDVICSKKASQLKRLHEATHFAIGCQKWDEDTRGASVSHSTFVDPEVVYATCDAPDKNMSCPDLRDVGYLDIDIKRQRNMDTKVYHKTNCNILQYHSCKIIAIQCSNILT